MIPCSFPESNVALGKPEGWSDEQCSPLSVCCTATPDGMPVVVSCWKLTKEEWLEIEKTKRVWLLVYGETMAPVAVQTGSPFVEAARQAKENQQAVCSGCKKVFNVSETFPDDEGGWTCFDCINGG